MLRSSLSASLCAVLALLPGAAPAAAAVVETRAHSSSAPVVPVLPQLSLPSIAALPTADPQSPAQAFAIELARFSAQPAATALPALQARAADAAAPAAQTQAARALLHVLVKPRAVDAAQLAASVGPAAAAAALRAAEAVKADAPAGSAQALQALFDGESPLARLARGERAYAPELLHQALDPKTINDLELYAEEGGLMAVLDKTKTAVGANRLRWLLAHPSVDPAEIRARQEALAELNSDAGLRARIDAAFEKHGKSVDERLLSHMQAPHSGKLDLIVPHIIQGILLAGATLFLPGVGPRALLQLGFTSLMLAGSFLDGISKDRVALGRYKAAFSLAREIAPSLARAKSEPLRRLGAALAVDDHEREGGELTSVSRSLKRLGVGPTMVLPDALWMQGAKTLWFLGRKLKRRIQQIAAVVGALGELDALRSLALHSESLGAKAATPRILDTDAAKLRIEAGHHPWLASRPESVPNDVVLEKGSDSFALLTGSNMGGKSTFLKMAVLNALVAQVGGDVAAAAMELTPMLLMTSIDIRDKLSSGKSLYDAETDRVLAVLGETDRSGRHLVALDEILQGTNPEESSAAQWAIVRHMARTGNLFLLATHDPKVTEIAGQEPGVTNLHVEESFEDGRMKFSHKVLPGPAASRNGLLTLRVKKFPQDIVEEAEEIVEKGR